MTELHYLTIAEAGARIRARTLSPVELTRAVLDRIAAIDGAVNAYILVLADQAMAEAHAAEAEIASGTYRGPLHGIPIGLKDIYNTAGIRTTGHSALFRDHVPAEDATTVRLLREAGAVVLGKLATWEFAIGGTSFDLPWPPARNPWNLSRDTAGSSSGSGAAVASGMALGAMGSDTGGSIRGPSAWCGLAGIKPTYGLVSRRGVLPLSFSLDHAGPMCWTSEDCALMMGVLAAHDPLDPASATVPPPDFGGAVGPAVAGLRVGVVRHFHEEEMQAEPETVAAFEDALKELAGAGAMLRDVRIAPFAAYGGPAGLISRSESFAIHQKWLRETPELYGAYGRRRLMAGAFVAAEDYVNANRERTRLVAELADTMRDVDVLVMPMARWPAQPIGEDSMTPDKQAFFSRAFNLTGSPAMSVCNGFSSSGLPLSLQVVGRPFEDHVVLRAGDTVERAMGTRSTRPEVTPHLAPAAQVAAQ